MKKYLYTLLYLLSHAISNRKHYMDKIYNASNRYPYIGGRTYKGKLVAKYHPKNYFEFTMVIGVS